MDLCVGDLVRVRCKEHMMNPALEKERVFIGTIVSLFNAFSPEGEDNWIIEIKCQPSGWFLYKPNIDLGSIEKIDEYPKNGHTPESNK